MTLAPRFVNAIESVSTLSRFGHPIGFAVIVVSIMTTSLMLAELVPRRVALARPERIARRCHGPSEPWRKSRSPLSGS